MALTRKLAKEEEDNSYGIDFPKTYFKVDELRIDVNNNKVRIGVRGYADETARKMENTIGIYKDVVTCGLQDLKLDKSKLLAEAYKFIKTLQKYESAKNV